MVITYKFKLIKSVVPEVRGKRIITDSNVGGIKNTYKIYRVRMYKIKVFGVELFTLSLSKLLGKKSFLRPYQSVWDKKSHRLPVVYWGKGPMLNLWLVLANDYKLWSDVKVLMPEDNTTKHTTSIFGINFLSQDLTKNLKTNQTFYQSKIVNNGTKSKKKINRQCKDR